MFNIFKSFYQFTGRSDTNHHKELPPAVFEKATSLFSDAMNAIKTRGTPAYFEYIQRIPVSHRQKLNYIIQWGVIYILESYDIR